MLIAAWQETAAAAFCAQVALCCLLFSIDGLAQKHCAITTGFRASAASGAIFFIHIYKAVISLDYGIRGTGVKAGRRIAVLAQYRQEVADSLAAGGQVFNVEHLDRPAVRRAVAMFGVAGGLAAFTTPAAVNIYNII